MIKAFFYLFVCLLMPPIFKVTLLFRVLRTEGVFKLVRVKVFNNLEVINEEFAKVKSK